MLSMGNVKTYITHTQWPAGCRAQRYYNVALWEYYFDTWSYSVEVIGRGFLYK